MSGKDFLFLKKIKIIFSDISSTSHLRSSVCCQHSYKGSVHLSQLLTHFTETFLFSWTSFWASHYRTEPRGLGSLILAWHVWLSLYFPLKCELTKCMMLIWEIIKTALSWVFFEWLKQVLHLGFIISRNIHTANTLQMKCQPLLRRKRKLPHPVECSCPHYSIINYFAIE